MTQFDPTAGHASRPLDSPEACPSCGAGLVDVPYEGPDCPHCGYNLETKPEGFGQAEQQRRHEQERSQGGPVR